jgi:hypothetical protein
MSTVSQLHNPVLGSTVPDDSGYSTPQRKHRGKVKASVKTHQAVWLGPMLTISTCAVLMLTVCGGLMVQKARLMELTYQLQRLQDELLVIQKEEAFLQMELISARSLRQVEQAAVNQLGMVKPEKVEYLVWEDPESSRTAVAAQTKTKAADTGLIASISRWFSENWPLEGRVEAKSRY